MHPAIAVPVTIYLMVRSYRRKSLTPMGILAATLTATIHALYPSSLPFTLLIVFFMLGTTATKVKHDIKATLTISSTGASGGEGARTSIQVLANSGFASLLILIHLVQNGRADLDCFSMGSTVGLQELIILGMVGNYAAVTADTLSSELGILSKSKPRLITAPWRIVPPGTNGGVTAAGLAAGMGGSLVIGLVSVLLISFCGHSGTVLQTGRPFWDVRGKALFVLAVAVWGTLGSVLDSLLGAVLQASVVDKRTGKVVEGQGGQKVLTTTARRPSGSGHGASGAAEGSRRIHVGRDLLDNNGVNFVMAASMGVGAMLVGRSVLS